MIFPFVRRNLMWNSIKNSIKDTTKLVAGNFWKFNKEDKALILFPVALVLLLLIFAVFG